MMMKSVRGTTALFLLSVAICFGVNFGTGYATPAKKNRQNLTVNPAESDPAGGYLMPEQFGAKGDGTDDTTAFLKAHDLIQKQGFGGIRLKPGRIYGINCKSRGVLFRLSNLAGYGIDAGGGATIRDLSTYQPGETAIGFQFINCKNIRFVGGLKVVSQAYSPASNKTGLSWFKFVSGCKGIQADVNFQGGLHGFHFYRNYGEAASFSTSEIRLSIKAKQVYYTELHERSGDNVETRIDAVDCGRAFFIFGGGNNITAAITAKNSFGFLISSDSAGNGSENITINYRDRDSDKNKAGNWRCGLQFYNQRPATFRNIKINLDVRNRAVSPFYDTFVINKVADSGGQDRLGRGHRLEGFEISGSSEQVNSRQHITMYGAFASPDSVKNIRIVNFSGTGQNSVIQLALGDALADTLLLENVNLPKDSIKINHSTGSVIFKGQ
jgi:hypothetical protein